MTPLARQVALWAVAATTAVGITSVGLGLVTDRVAAPPAAIELAGVTAAPTMAPGRSATDDETLAPSPSPDDPTTDDVLAASPSDDPSASEEPDGADRSSSPDDTSSGPSGSAPEPDDDRTSSSPDDGPSSDDRSDDDASPDDDEPDEPDDDESDSEEPSADDSDEPDEVESTSDEPSGGESSAAPVDETRTIQTLGGTVRFRFTDGRVDVVYRTPTQGFTVEVDRDGPDEVRVTFTSDDHRSRVDADLDDGEPRVRVREESED